MLTDNRKMGKAFFGSREIVISAQSDLDEVKFGWFLITRDPGIKFHQHYGRYILLGSAIQVGIR